MRSTIVAYTVVSRIHDISSNLVMSAMLVDKLDIFLGTSRVIPGMLVFFKIGHDSPRISVGEKERCFL